MSDLQKLISTCERLHSFIGWYCMSCDSEVDATFNEHCYTCGTKLDSQSTIAGNMVEAAKAEFEELQKGKQPAEPTEEPEPMHSHAEDPCDEIDSCMFSGDTFAVDEDAMKRLEWYMGRWSRRMAENRKFRDAHCNTCWEKLDECKCDKEPEQCTTESK